MTLDRVRLRYESMAGMMTWLPIRHAVLTIAMTCLGLPEHLLGQRPETGQITGHVVDVVGATIKGASVFVRRNMPSDDNVKLLAHTDINGDFTLVLPEGGYDVLVTSPGFAANVETVAVLARKPRKLRWKLKVLDCTFPGMNCDTFQ
jgi:hypothetical protein